MNKNKIIERIENDENPTIKEILHWVKTMTVNLENPSRYKKGDVFSFNQANKPRPYVVVKQVKDIIIAIPLTTCADELSVGKYNSRFFGVGYFSKSLTTLKTSHLEDRLIGVLDDNKAITNAFKLIKNHFIN